MRLHNFSILLLGEFGNVVKGMMTDALVHSRVASRPPFKTGPGSEILTRLKQWLTGSVGFTL